MPKSNSQKLPDPDIKDIKHLTVFAEEGAFGAWPANGGMWTWDNEILFSFTRADHVDKEGHSYDRSSSRRKFARSLDGGRTWSIEDAFRAGITAVEWDHQLPPEKAQKPTALTERMNCRHPDFALIFGRMNNSDGPSCFYYSYDRGHHWNGPHAFPDLDTRGVATRTDYHVEGEHELLVFLTTAKADGDEGRVACARTVDGGITWERIAWVSSEPEAKSKGAIMPASVKLGPGHFFVMIRQWSGLPNKPGRKGKNKGLVAYESSDNAQSWQMLDTPELGNLPGQTGEPVHNPPALVKLQDGRLCLAYGVRQGPAHMVVRLSKDDGRSWGREHVVRGEDGANFDMGYPRITQRPDGKVILVYYYNHALLGGKPYRFIAATIFNPEL